MRIGLDGIPLHEPRTGVGHYTFELSRALAVSAPRDQFELISPVSYWSPTGAAGQPELPANLRLQQAPANVLNRYWWAVGLPRYIKRNSFALFHGTNYDIPLRGRCPTVLTIHDLSLLLHPETHERARTRRARRRLPLMARLATRIVTHTESARAEVCEHLGVPPGKVIAVPAAARNIFKPMPPAQAAAARRRLGVADEFLLFVGTIEPRKNLPALISAFREALQATAGRTQLVIAGREGWLTGELTALLDKSGIKERILFTGYLSDADLCALYSSCRAFIYPSLYEGFGLPPLEAMACGAPVVASRIPSIVEVVGDAAHLVTAREVSSLAQALIAMLRDDNERQHWVAAGLKRASAFSWERTASLMREVYAEACAAR